MGKRGVRTSGFHSLEGGPESYVHGTHGHPKQFGQHVFGCKQCQTRLFNAGDQGAIELNEKPIRMLLRTYALLASAGRVPSTQELRENRDPQFLAYWRRHALVRLVMDFGDMMDEFRGEAVDQEQPSAGKAPDTVDVGIMTGQPSPSGEEEGDLAEADLKHAPAEAGEVTEAMASDPNAFLTGGYIGQRRPDDHGGSGGGDPFNWGASPALLNAPHSMTVPGPLDTSPAIVH